MKIGFLLNEIEEDLIDFLNKINFEFVIIQKSFEKEEEQFKENVKLIKTANFEKAIKDNDIRILFVSKEIDYKSKECINVKIVDNEYERFVFDYDFYAIRTKKLEDAIYFPYFIDFDFFSNYRNKFKKYEKVKRITLLTNSIDITLVSFLEKFVKLRNKVKNLQFLVYKASNPSKIDFINFIDRNLNKKERADLYYFSDLIISLEDRKKEVLEAMSMKKVVVTNDGFLNTPQLSFENFENKILRLIDFGEYEVNKIIAQEYSIENSAQIFEKELKNFIEVNQKLI